MVWIGLGQSVRRLLPEALCEVRTEERNSCSSWHTESPAQYRFKGCSTVDPCLAGRDHMCDFLSGFDTNLICYSTAIAGVPEKYD